MAPKGVIPPCGVKALFHKDDTSAAGGGNRTHFFCLEGRRRNRLSTPAKLQSFFCKSFMYSLLSSMQEYSWTSKEQSPVSFYTYLRKSSRDNLRESQSGHTPSGLYKSESTPPYACNSFLHQRTEGNNSFFPETIWGARNIARVLWKQRTKRNEYFHVFTWMQKPAYKTLQEKELYSFSQKRFCILWSLQK